MHVHILMRLNREDLACFSLQLPADPQSRGRQSLDVPGAAGLRNILRGVLFTALFAGILFKILNNNRILGAG